MYLWEHADWPALRWDAAKLLGPVAAARFRQGRLLGGMERLGAEARREAELAALTEDIVRSAEFEGDDFDPAAVRAALAARLGGAAGPAAAAEARIDTIAAMRLAAAADHDAPLTA
jgi:hypothetical protein